MEETTTPEVKQSRPSGSEVPPNGSNPRARFARYRDYVEHLISDHGFMHLQKLRAYLDFDYPSPPEAPAWEDLRLLRFGTQGELVSTACVHSYHVSAQDSQQDYPGFIETLKAHSSAVHHQVLLVQTELGNRRFRSPATLSETVPRPWIIEELGFALDTGHDFWNALLSNRRPELKNAWIGAAALLDIQGDILLLLDEIQAVRPKTAVIFLGPRRPGHMTGHLNLHGFGSPSQCTSPEPQCTRAKPLTAKMDALESLISAPRDLPTDYGVANSLFSTVEALLRFDMCETPLNVPQQTEADRVAEPKYEEGYARAFDSESDFDLDDYFVGPRLLDRNPDTVRLGAARLLWEKLHNEVLGRRETLLHLRDFVEDHFDLSQAGFKRGYDRIFGRYERHVQWLELHKARLRESIDMENSQKSSTMAELSIAESKRMMSLTFAAFVYLPASFAAAIFGMNVQEINETGHGVTSFVVVAIVLLVITLLVWATSVQIARYRKDRSSDLQRYRVLGGRQPRLTIWTACLDWILLVDGLRFERSLGARLRTVRDERRRR